MRQYELTYLISDNVSESDLNKVTGKVGGYVKDADGKVLKEEIWGRRKLAYPIQKQEFATYVTVNFDLPAENAREFEHNIKMTSKIIRHLMIVKDFGEEKLTLTTEDITKAEEIKEVIGGEKTFEVIEGETEESKDLMAVRGSTTQISDTDLAQKEQEQEEIKEETKGIDSEQKESQAEETAPAKEAGEEIKEKTAKEPVVKSKKTAEKAEAESKENEEPEEKKPRAKKAKSEDSEADRLSKLDKELDDILGEDL